MTNDYNESLVLQGMRGEKIVAKFLSDRWKTNDTSDISNYCIASGPDIYKSNIIGIEVKFWLQRYLDQRSFNDDVIPRLKNSKLGVLVLLFDSKRKRTGYGKYVRELSLSNGIIPVLIDINERNFSPIEKLEERLSLIFPRLFSNNKVITDKIPLTSSSFFTQLFYNIVYGLSSIYKCSGKLGQISIISKIILVMLLGLFFDISEEPPP